MDIGTLYVSNIRLAVTVNSDMDYQKVNERITWVMNEACAQLMNMPEMLNVGYSMELKKLA